ncbi:hypothetical protein D9756_007412 [Leucocoprinus leucothites]|uniref:Uncharacterized protein n=1 Tax=Leucocoprinus leucothites TaxID=201217 RepID=A0A8H5D3X4_9AGAR|nr:hypothetical protein D9756_007412 [Leucoagaricus leucothites]
MATFYQQPMMIPGPGLNQAPSAHSQPSVQAGPYWNPQDYSPPRAASFTPTQVLNNGRSSYDYVAERVRDNPGGPQSVDLSEAKHWYRQAYQQGLLDGLSSWELGHAAAYRAYRILRDDPPIHGSPGNERETLIGLAVAEASKLIRQSGREREADANTAASETSARTASRIFDQTHINYTGESRPRPIPGTAYSDPHDYYTGDVSAGYARQPSSRARGRSPSRTRHPSFVDTLPTVIPNAFPGYHANSANRSNGHFDVPFGGMSRSAPGPKYPPTPHPGSDFPPGTVVVSLPTTAAPHTMTPQTYQEPQGTSPMPFANYAPTAYDHYSRPRSASFSYPQQYTNQQNYRPPPASYSDQKSIAINTATVIAPEVDEAVTQNK